MTLKKDILYNSLFISILSIYAVEVCPHVSKLGLLITCISFLIVLVPLFILRYQISSRTKNKTRLFIINLSYFVIIGIVVGLFNFLHREYPIESALKIITGALFIGIINSIIYSLEYPFIKTKIRMSFISRISLFLVLILVMIGTVWVLLMKENLSLFNAVQNGSMINLVSSIIIETLFVMAIMILYFFRIIYLYKYTLQSGIRSQIESLNEVRKDNLNVILPRFSNDEFSIISDEVNQMISRLRQGEKIKGAFEKVTGQNIDSDVIGRISKGDFTSEQKEMAVLFSDIKGFTALCEKSEPKQFVIDLNNHFELMVQAIKDFDGTINKFIGDAILVCFEGPESCNRAVKASLRMIEKSNFKIGVGINHGQLLAGLLGCQERLEYSIIGSVVNKSARLESATRTLNADIVISESTAINISEKNIKGFNKTSIALKGFEENETVYYK